MCSGPLRRCSHVCLSRYQGLSGQDQLGRIRLIAPGLLRFRRWTGDTPFSATDPAGWRIYSSTRSGTLNRRCESSAVAGVASHFHGSRFLLSHAAGRTISCRNSAKHYRGQGRRQTGMGVNPKVKLTRLGRTELPIVSMRRIFASVGAFFSANHAADVHRRGYRARVPSRGQPAGVSSRGRHSCGPIRTTAGAILLVERPICSTET